MDNPKKIITKKELFLEGFKKLTFKVDQNKPKNEYLIERIEDQTSQKKKNNFLQEKYNNQSLSNEQQK